MAFSDSIKSAQLELLVKVVCTSGAATHFGKSLWTERNTHSAILQYTDGKDQNVTSGNCSWKAGRAPLNCIYLCVTPNDLWLLHEVYMLTVLSFHDQNIFASQLYSPQSISTSEKGGQISCDILLLCSSNCTSGLVVT